MLRVSLRGRRTRCMDPAGIMLKVTGSAMTGAPSASPLRVFAAAAPGDHEAPAAGLLNRDELSLYAAPVPKRRYADAPEEVGQLEQSVAIARKSVGPYAAWCRGVYAQVRPKVASAVQLGTDAYGYLQNPPKDFYPRAGVIGFTGVLGLVLGRGSRIKKLIYPAALMTLSTSLYYPERAAELAKNAGDSVYERAVQSFAAAEKLFKGPAAKGDKDGESKAP